MALNPNIAFINQSSIVSDQEALSVMNALQIQLTRDFFPVWGENATLVFFSRNQQPPPGYWWLVISDSTESAEAAGYHDLSTEGMPMGYIFARVLSELGLQWSNTASHELLEMVEDPGTNICVRRQDDKGDFALYAYEVCDPCEDDQFGYMINGILVSDFVFPSWFEDFKHPDGTQYDFMNYITAPFQILEGGFISVNEEYSNSGWNMEYGAFEKRTYHMRPHRGSRRDRRRTPRREWLSSRLRF